MLRDPVGRGRVCSPSSSRVITNPDSVKKTDTPRKPPGSHLGFRWYTTTAATATPRSPSSAWIRPPTASVTGCAGRRSELVGAAECMACPGLVLASDGLPPCTAPPCHSHPMGTTSREGSGHAKYRNRPDRQTCNALVTWRRTAVPRGTPAAARQLASARGVHEVGQPVVIVLDTGFLVAQSGLAEPTRVHPALHVTDVMNVLIDRDVIVFRPAMMSS